MRSPKFLLSAICLSAIVAAAPASSQASAPPTPRAPSRTALGTSSTQILLAKITVSDLPKSYAFYTKLVGLKHATSPGQPAMPDPVPANDKQPDFVEVPLNFSGSLADPFFVLVQQRGQKPAPATARMSWIGFKVPDAPAAVRRVKEAGYEVIREPAVVQPGEIAVGLVRDPDGYTVEFVQAANYPAR